MQYEFLATPEDRTGSASLWLGSGMKMPAPKLPRLKYFAGMDMMNKMMKMNGDMEPMGMEMSLQDRKSVVRGKRVSVRVAFGGRRISTKTTKVYQKLHTIYHIQHNYKPIY